MLIFLYDIYNFIYSCINSDQVNLCSGMNLRLTDRDE